MAADPWVVQPHEHAKFAEHFRNLGPVNGHLTGEQAKRFMLQSQLPPPILGQIWSLADTNADGKLDLREFSIACKIINLKLHNIEVPKALPPSLLASLSPTGAPKPQFAQPPAAPVAAPIKPPIPPMPALPTQPLISGLTTTQPSNQSLLGDLVGPPLVSQPPLIPPIAKPIVPNVPDLISGVKPGQPVAATTQPIAPLMGQPLNQPILPTQPITSQPLVAQPMLPAQPVNLIGQQPMFSQVDQFSLNNQPLVQPMVPPQPRPYTSPPETQAASSPLTGQPIGPTTIGSLVNSPPSLVNSVVAQPITSTPLTAMKSDSMSKPGSLVTSPTEMPMGVMSPPPAVEWGIPQPQKLKYTQLFNATDRAKTGAVSGVQARSIMLQSRLPQQALAQSYTNIYENLFIILK